MGRKEGKPRMLWVRNPHVVGGVRIVRTTEVRKLSEGDNKQKNDGFRHPVSQYLTSFRHLSTHPILTPIN